MLNMLIAVVVGLTIAGLSFTLFACFTVAGFWRKALNALKKPLAFIAILGWAMIAMAAVTQINLATQVYGTLPAASMPNPSASTLGGIQSITAVSHEWINSISTSGVPNQTQPAFSDISGSPSTTQVPFQSLTTTGSSGAATLSAGVLNIPNYASTVINQAAPTGTINGSNTSFTLGFTPGNSSNVVCYLNGVMQQQGSGNDYTISGTTITYLTAPPTGSKLICTGY
jgi:hypothetical protein